MRKYQTPQQIYKGLRTVFLRDYKGHFRDMYEGHHHAERMATRYAIDNTKEVWELQWQSSITKRR